ncbi:efflux transporter outer membrane subunit [Sphingobium sufflavum]|uniref:efflux transporter outer membrane subunit n=1 Tax=Sphingobium sufflavum TaxID=1129547 RepID=UPI001F47A334|nr:efflux transporter outer membrane subunit [Sphingobium sufflavum]MCE7795660.1 efflux transporter outer membrane subunit [Sphingobium sufflavum]
MLRQSLLIPAILLAGCTVGPDYRRPMNPAASANWVEPADTGAVHPLWWQTFDDPALTALITRALLNGPDMAEATARLREARANRDAAAGGTLPTLTAKGSATENRLSENGQIPIGAIPGFSRDMSLFDAGFDASWEIDLWGRDRRRVEGASARAQAAAASRSDVMVMLAAEVARNYVDLRAAQADARALTGIAEADAALSRLIRLRFAAGEASRLDAESAESAARASAAAIPDARAMAAAAAYRIAALVGAPPEEVAPDLIAQPAPQPRSPATILVGVRSDLLRRRSDILRAERELAAATADIGVAKADLFPRFSLFGSIGQQARRIGDLGDGGSTRFQVGPSFSWPIFAAGTIRAQVRASSARADAAAARYEKAVLGALSDSETAINRFLNARSAQGDADTALAAQDAAHALAVRRTERGEDDRLALMRATHSRLAIERLAIGARRAEALAAVALFKALGGWWMEGPVAVPPLAPVRADR